jgi:hypothetical protein
MAAVSAGEVTGHGAVGEIYCRLLSACEHAGDVRRAEEWMGLVDRYIVWERFVRPTCKTHYGGILIAQGRWSAAETELLDAIRGSIAGTGATGSTRWSDSRISVCARGGTKRQSA